MNLTGQELTWIVVSYFLGCFTAGYYLIRWWAGTDLRFRGSGNPGARNAGRVAGRSWFMVVLATDMAKGAIAVGVAQWVQMDPHAVMASMIAVVAGHIWPLPLKFQGGKGVAVSTGAILLLDYQVIVIMLVILIPALLFFRNFTLSGMLAYGFAPFLVFWGGWGAPETFAVSVTSVMVLLAHRGNIREDFQRLWQERQSKPMSDSLRKKVPHE